MDKSEQKQKIEELKGAIRDKDFDKAVEVADTLEVKKIKDNNLLYLMADAYEHNKDYASAKKVLLVAYDHTTTGRHIAYRLCLLSIKMKDFAEARDYYEDFLGMAPRDTARYVLKYKMAEALEKPIEDLIAILEEYVNLDMEEKWAYELAKLYHVVGDKEKCIDICDEISLWFSDGKYVSKAMDLKKMYSPLTPAQQEKYDEKKRKVMEEAEEAERKARELKPFEVNINMITDIPEVKIEPEMTDEKMQAVVADGMKEIFAESEEELLEEAENLENESDVEDLGETKIFGNTNGRMEEILFQTKENEEVLNKEIEKEEKQEDSIQEEVVEDKVMEEIEEVEKIEEVVENEEIKEEVLDSVEPIQDISGVADILRQLQERGILKAETVEQAVNIIDEAGSAREELEETKEEPKETVAENSGVSIDETEFEEVDAMIDSVETVATKDNKNTVDDEIAIDKEEISDNISEKSEEENQVKEDEFALEEETMHTKQFEIPKEVAREDIPEEDVPKEEVPIFDLSFEAPERDESKDIGNDIDETIATESDLGFRTNTPSAKVEIISGAGIVEEGELEETESVESPVLKEDKSEQMDETEAILEKIKSLDVLSEEEEKVPERIEPEKESEPEEKASETGETEKAPEPKEIEEEISVEPEIVLTEEELTAFKNYLNVEGFESNIREVLQKLIVNYNPNGKSSEGNVVIMGSEKTGKTTLAIEIIKLVNNKRGRRNRKLAKVNATALNRRGFRNALNKLLGSDLIIENAEQLGIMTLSEIIDVSGMFTDDMLIILEGETEGMTKLLEDSSRATQVFNHVITIREYDIKEWVEYGKRYANTKGYSLDELANLAFYKAIDDFFGANKGIGKNDVESIVDDAIAKSGRIGRKLTGIFSSKKDDEGLNILMESDFNI